MRSMITESTEIIINHTVFGCQVHVLGACSDVGAVGWAYVLADRLMRRGLESHVEGGGRGDGRAAPWAILTVSGYGLYQLVCECLGEVS